MALPRTAIHRQAPRNQQLLRREQEGAGEEGGRGRPTQGRLDPSLTVPARAASALVATAAVLAVAAAQAVAIAPPRITSPPSPSPAQDWTFTFSATPDDGNAIVGYEGALAASPSATPEAPIASPAAFSGLAEGPHHLRVRAVQQAQGPDGALTRSGYATASILVDRTAPSIAATLDPAQPNGLNGWYRGVTVRFACADAGSGVASCPPADLIGDRGAADQGPDQTRAGTALDRAGLQAAATSPAFRFDNVAPRSGQPKVPGQNAKLSAEPTFVWTPGGPDTSGVARYEVHVRIPSGGRLVERLVATVPHSGAPEFAAVRTPLLWPAAFPERVALSWFVRTIDVAGNVSANSASRAFTIDSSRPAAPAITGGPAGPTNVAAPAFSWSGSGATYAWDVTPAGAERPVQAGGGAAPQAALGPLPQGDYVFRVSQTSAFGVESAEASRSFQVDVTPPAAPVITSRPQADAAGPASFAWTTEPGAFSRWHVAGSAGSVVQGPSDTPLPRVTLGPLRAGAYAFRVVQVDAAGNVSREASDAFTITAAASRTATPLAARRLALPRSNASRLRPRAGVLLSTRRPHLSWRGGPPGITVYNVQLFRVVRRVAGRSPVTRKALSAFPRARSYRVPAGRLRPGTCYVWRVWPFAKTRFTPTPLGVSNFCVRDPRQPGR